MHLPRTLQPLSKRRKSAIRFCGADGLSMSSAPTTAPGLKCWRTDWAWATARYRGGLLGGWHFAIDHPEALELDQFRPGRYISALGTYETLEPDSARNAGQPIAVMVPEQVELWSEARYPSFPRGTLRERQYPHNIEAYVGRNFRARPEGL